MNHLSDLQCSMFADGALIGAEQQSATKHLQDCDQCHQRVSSLVEAKQLITSVIGATDDVHIPPFARPAGYRDFIVINLVMAFMLWAAVSVWKLVSGLLGDELLSLLVPLVLPNGYDLTIDTVLYFVLGESTMIVQYATHVLVVSLVAFLAWMAFSLRKKHSLAGLCLYLILGFVMYVPEQAQALEIRSGEQLVTVAADEIISDTLVIGGDSILVEGKIDGDLIAIARRVIIRGEITGNLVTMGETTTINAVIGGTVFAGARTVKLDKSSVGGDFWGFGSDVSIATDASVLGNATTGAELIYINGQIDRDLTAFGEQIELGGTVKENMQVWARKVSLLGNATVVGNLAFHTNDKENLIQTPGTKIQGNIEFVDLPTDSAEPNRYLTGEFYLVQLMKLVAAFLVGLCLIWLVPRMQILKFPAGSAGFKTLGIGVTALIGLPVAAIVVAITIVGLPFSLAAIFSWVSLIYLAKVITGLILGRLLVDPANSPALSLLAGLVLVLVLVNVPFIGGLISLVLTIAGIGLLVQMLLKEFGQQGQTI